MVQIKRRSNSSSSRKDLAHHRANDGERGFNFGAADIEIVYRPDRIRTRRQHVDAAAKKFFNEGGRVGGSHPEAHEVGVTIATSMSMPSVPARPTARRQAFS